MSNQFVVIKRMVTNEPVIKSATVSQNEVKISVLYPEGEVELKKLVHETMKELNFNSETENLEQELNSVLEIIEVGSDVSAIDYVDGFKNA